MTNVIDVNPWFADKEQKRFHDIKVEHDILRYKINTRINTSKCLFGNIRRWGDHILNYLLTEGSFPNPFDGRINLLFVYTVCLWTDLQLIRLHMHAHVELVQPSFHIVIHTCRPQTRAYNNSSIKTFLTNPDCSLGVCVEIRASSKMVGYNLHIKRILMATYVITYSADSQSGTSSSESRLWFKYIILVITAAHRTEGALLKS